MKVHGGKGLFQMTAINMGTNPIKENREGGILDSVPVPVGVPRYVDYVNSDRGVRKVRLSLYCRLK